jgi:hypothetical protein
MNKIIGRKLNMAVRARDFSVANPSADPNFVLVLDRLTGAIDRVVALGGRQVTGRLSRHASIVERQEVRRKLRNDLLPHLVTIARTASVDQPMLGDQFEIPGHNLSNARFYAAAKAMLELGLAEQEVLLKHGLSDTLLPDLEGTVNAYAATITTTNASREELEEVGDQIMQLVDVMDGINRYRFRDDPARLVAWEAARHVVTGPRKSDTDTSPSVPAGSAVKPAA